MKRSSRNVLILAILAGAAALFAGTPTAQAGGYHGRSYHSHRSYCPPRIAYRSHYRSGYYGHYRAPRYSGYRHRHVYTRPHVVTGRHYRKYGYFYPYCR